MSNLQSLRVVLTSSNLPAVVVGQPGIGKTAQIRQLAADLKWNFHTFSVGDVGEGAFGVVPVPVDGVLQFPPAAWVRKFPPGEPGLLFLDDVHAAPPALQAPLAGMVLDGRIGDFTLHAGVKRVAAMNPISQGAGAWDFAASLANRFCYLPWAAPTSNEWSEWLVKQPYNQRGCAPVSDSWRNVLAMSEEAAGKPAEQPTPEADSEGGTPGWTRAKQLAAAFHRCNAGKLAEDPVIALADRFPPAYTTPRSWEAVVRVHAGCLDLDCEGVFPSLAEGCIGRPITVEYLTWLRQNDLPDPEVLLADPELWEPSALEPDKAFATAAAVADAATRKHKRKDARWFAAWKILERGLRISRGTIAIAARKLAEPKHRPDKWREDATTVRVVRELREVLEAVQ